MAYISYDNIRVGINAVDTANTGFADSNTAYAANFSASNSTALKRVRRIGQQMDYYIQTGPKSANISMTVVPVTGVGSNQLMDYIAMTGDSTSGSFIHVPNYFFQKCFLKSLSVNFEPWRVTTANLQFDSYGLASGNGLNSYAAQQSTPKLISPLRGTSITITSPSFTQNLNAYENVNLSIEVDRVANYQIGDAYPAKTSVAKITKHLQVNGISNIDWLSDYQPNTTVTATLTMADGNTFSVAGVLSNQTVSIDANGVAKGGLQVIEEMV